MSDGSQISRLASLQPMKGHMMARGAPRRAILLAVCSVAALAAAATSASTAAAHVAGDAGLRGPYSSGLFAPRGAHLPFPGAQRAVCGQANVGSAQCLIHILAPAAQSAATVTSPTGLSPATIKSVYGYTSSSSAGAGETIALVDAYNDPSAASDLNKFSAQYGLPSVCTGGATPPSCFDFSQVNQTGGSSLPATNASWDLEISLDIEWAHAIAPGASILLVEATSNAFANLLAAESYAAAHANYVSNSWGSSEFAGESSDDSYFTRAGVSYFAAAGDTASSVLWPSASPDVISVGGTSLTFTTGGSLAQESAWSGGGGGCSSNESASVSQSTGSVSCAGKRATPDLSLDADPNSGASVYDSVSYSGQSGWWTVGGTSASTVLVAADAAVAGADVNASYVYAAPAKIPFRDIILGSNGHPALTGYDLATGLGSWSYTPGAPTGLTATGGSGAVTLSWTAPTGASVAQYDIWRGTASGQEATNVATITAPTTSYTDTSVTGGVTYYYEVQAVNTAGVGPFSNEARATPTVASATLTASPASVTGGQTVTINWSGVATPTSTDWVGLYHPGDPNTPSIDWFYADNCTQTNGTTALASGTCTYTMPATAGTYQFRLLANNGYTVIATSNSVTDSGATATLTASPASVTGGQSVTINWSGVTTPTSTDWVGLYHPGDPNTPSIDWFYADNCTQTNGTTALASGTCTYTMPATAGTYQFRLLANNGYTVIATSNTVTDSG
jgi:subtilase family serine protease